MHKAKGTISKALRIHLQQEGTNNGVDHHEPSFRVLYYGDASAGSVPFMWESHPGTPKHALTESSLPPLTPPPSFQNHISSSMQLSKHSSNRSGFLRTGFLRKTANVEAAPLSSYSSCSISSSSSSSSSSHLHSSQSTPTRKTEVWRRRSAVKFGLEEDYGEQGMHGGSPTSTLCFGCGFRRGYRVKKVKTAILSFVRHEKA